MRTHTVVPIQCAKDLQRHLCRLFHRRAEPLQLCVDWRRFRSVLLLHELAHPLLRLGLDAVAEVMESEAARRAVAIVRAHGRIGRHDHLAAEQAGFFALLTFRVRCVSRAAMRLVEFYTGASYALPVAAWARQCGSAKRSEPAVSGAIVLFAAGK